MFINLLLCGCWEYFSYTQVYGNVVFVSLGQHSSQNLPWYFIQTDYCIFHSPWNEVTLPPQTEAPVRSVNLSVPLFVLRKMELK